MKLSQYFTLEEFIFSETATRRGIDNMPKSEDMITQLKITAGQMDDVRKLLGKPIRVTSGYRCPLLNAAIGSTGGGHVAGYAVDFISPKFGKPKKIVDAIIASDIQYDQIIFEGTWVHISFDPRYRMQTLTAIFTPGQKTRYVSYS
jgi:putative chitinase